MMMQRSEVWGSGQELRTGARTLWEKRSRLISFNKNSSSPQNLFLFLGDLCLRITPRHYWYLTIQWSILTSVPPPCPSGSAAGRWGSPGPLWPAAGPCTETCWYAQPASPPSGPPSPPSAPAGTRSCRWQPCSPQGKTSSPGDRCGIEKLYTYSTRRFIIYFNLTLVATWNCSLRWHNCVKASLRQQAGQVNNSRWDWDILATVSIMTVTSVL